MMRMQAFEFEDAAWLPPVLRDGITDFLRLIAENLGIFRATAPVLRDLAAETGASRIVDLCAGAGGPMLALREQIARDFGLDLQLVLTDLYPNQRAFRMAQNRGGDAVRALSTPVDASDVPQELAGIRTLFNSLHHLQPDQIDALLADAVAKSQPVAIFEFVERSFIAFVSICATPALVYLLTPMAESRSLRRYLFTYVLPVIPAMVWWDGIASCLRAYSDAELEDICKKHRCAQYEFRVGRVHAPFIRAPIRFLLGVPQDFPSPSAAASTQIQRPHTPG